MIDTVIVGRNEKGEVESRKGVRQGCSLLPPLVNSDIEEAKNELKEEICNIVVNVHSKKIQMLRIAENIALLESAEKHSVL